MPIAADVGHNHVDGIGTNVDRAEPHGNKVSSQTLAVIHTTPHPPRAKKIIPQNSKSIKSRASYSPMNATFQLDCLSYFLCHPDRNLLLGVVLSGVCGVEEPALSIPEGPRIPAACTRISLTEKPTHHLRCVG